MKGKRGKLFPHPHGFGITPVIQMNQIGKVPPKDRSEIGQWGGPPRHIAPQATALVVSLASGQSWKLYQQGRPGAGALLRQLAQEAWLALCYFSVHFALEASAILVAHKL